MPIFHSCWFNETLNRVDVDSWFGCVCVYHSLSETQVGAGILLPTVSVSIKTYCASVNQSMSPSIEWSTPSLCPCHSLVVSRSHSLSLHTTATARTIKTRKSQPKPWPGAKKNTNKQKKNIEPTWRKQPPNHLNRLLEALIHHQCESFCKVYLGDLGGHFIRAKTNLLIGKMIGKGENKNKKNRDSVWRWGLTGKISAFFKNITRTIFIVWGKVFSKSLQVVTIQETKSVWAPRMANSGSLSALKTPFQKGEPFTDKFPWQNGDGYEKNM